MKISKAASACAAALVICASLALPAAVGGATDVLDLQLKGGGIIVAVSGSEGDDELTIAISEDGLDLLFEDPDGVSAPIPPCVRESASSVRCPAAGVDEIEIDLGDGDDVLMVIGIEAEIEVDGEEGNDRLDGGAGPDRMQGGPGSDRIDGNLGADTRDGGPGDDVLLASAGDDVQIGAQGNDVISGGPGNDVQFGGSGQDRLLGGPGRDRQDGGKGRDRCVPGAGPARPAARCEN